MEWDVLFGDEFELEFLSLSADIQDGALAIIELLREFGPRLGRPHADTLKGSRHANMKELRFSAGDGVWRIAFAFDPKRKAILLVAGDKSGGGEKRFYNELLRKADERFEKHLQQIKKRK